MILSLSPVQTAYTKVWPVSQICTELHMAPDWQLTIFTTDCSYRSFVADSGVIFYAYKSRRLSAKDAYSDLPVTSVRLHVCDLTMHNRLDIYFLCFSVFFVWQSWQLFSLWACIMHTTSNCRIPSSFTLECFRSSFFVFQGCTDVDRPSDNGWMLYSQDNSR